MKDADFHPDDLEPRPAHLVSLDFTSVHGFSEKFENYYVLEFRESRHPPEYLHPPFDEWFDFTKSIQTDCNRSFDETDSITGLTLHWENGEFTNMSIELVTYNPAEDYIPSPPIWILFILNKATLKNMNRFAKPIGCSSAIDGNRSLFQGKAWIVYLKFELVNEFWSDDRERLDLINKKGWE